MQRHGAPFACFMRQFTAEAWARKTQSGRCVVVSVAMFVIELIYKAELHEIDARMKDHVAFLKRHYDAGRFLVSGRKIPRDGGIILALGESRAQIEAIMREDPFCAH